ncbi:hypothetical protein Skr01_72140 [Sphaerisporangium krabiense]|uniref:Uncharacterized protein n=1 Tax=Sphaerisporangium krabiense TaxID=763782 RepID=A0A7W8Z6P3_9ACTN|nr:hypothetical protein [Sphaerisporangium krabiense]MBB5628488.1 hypothetical protein [Sphaerisporangium krabiense]GII67129.1 hypothetical protein Skr01_72140 [Sphaerisporangium krabiense]
MITTRGLVLRSIGTLAGLGGLACCLTMLYLGARAVMSVGGSCGSGGRYATAVPCPDGVAWLIPVSTMGGILALGVYLGLRLPVGPRLAALAWPALFLSLGWAFLDSAMADPALGLGIMIPGVVFMIMGGAPLALLFHRSAARAVFVGPAPARPPVTTRAAGRSGGPSGGTVRWTTSVVLPGQDDLPRDAVDLDDPPQDRPTYPPPRTAPAPRPRSPRFAYLDGPRDAPRDAPWDAPRDVPRDAPWDA